MKSIFCLFPCCYIKANKRGCLVFDTNTGISVVEKNPNISTYFTNEESNSYILSDDDVELMKFVRKCISKNMGYILKCKVEPAFPNNRFIFISSLRKELKYTGSFPYQDMLEIISQINVFTGNQTLQLDHTCYPQIDYPEWNIPTIFDPCFLLKKYKMGSVRKVIISGDLNITIVKQIRSIFPNIDILCRISYDNYIRRENEIRLLCNKDKLLSLSIIVLDLSKIKKQSRFIHDVNSCRYKLEPIIRQINDLKYLNSLDSHIITYRPVIYDKKVQKKLIDEMLVSKTDIVSSKLLYDDIALRDVINPSFYGKITISCDGTIQCGNAIIGSVLSGDFLEILSDWLTHENIWYSPRKLKKSCSDCLFSALCPPLTIFEYQNILNKICKKD